jgi:TRAP-type uncharacterized transport system substrate-binding protein
MAEAIRLSSTEGGGNWWRVITWAAEGFKAAGFDVDLKRFGPHGDNTCARVARGESDICVSLRSFAIQAARGDKPFGPESKAVRGLALMMHPGHIFYAMLAKETGIASFEELARRRPRLNLCVPGDGAGQEVVSAILRGYGIDGLDEVKSWGGEFFLGFDEAARLVLSGKSDGIMRENTRPGPAGQAASGRDMHLLSLDRDIAARIGAEYGLDVVEIPAESFRNQSRSVIALQNGGYPMVCGAHLDAGLIYRLAKAIDEDFPRHYASEDIFYSPKHAPDTGCPLHPGAARYYREIGRLA